MTSRPTDGSCGHVARFARALPPASRCGRARSHDATSSNRSNASSREGARTIRHAPPPPPCESRGRQRGDCTQDTRPNGRSHRMDCERTGYSILHARISSCTSAPPAPAPPLGRSCRLLRVEGCEGSVEGRYVPLESLDLVEHPVDVLCICLGLASSVCCTTS